MSSVFRNSNGFWYVRHEGRISNKRSHTAEQAQAHLDKLQRGLVKFEPLGSNPEPICAGLTARFAHAGVARRSHNVRT